MERLRDKDIWIMGPLGSTLWVVEEVNAKVLR